MFYGGLPAEGVLLDTDTMSFGKGGNLEDVSLQQFPCEKEFVVINIA